MQELFKIALQGMQNRFSQNDFKPAKQKELYERRLRKEVAVIEGKRLGQVFFILADIANWAKELAIPIGPGRGALPGCLTSYCLGITDVDPICHGLIFERFLNNQMNQVHHFSLDFSKGEKSRIISYIRNKFDSENDKILLVLNHEMSFQDLLQYIFEKIRFPQDKRESITNMLPNGTDFCLRDFLGATQLDNPSRIDSEVKLLLTILSIAEELQSSSHSDISRIILVAKFEKEDSQPGDTIHFDLIWSDDIKLLQGVLHRIAESTGKHIDPGKIPVDDDKPYMLMGKGNTRGVPLWQRYEDRWYIRKRLQPKQFPEVTALYSLMRPGPIENGMMDSFVDRCVGDEATEYPVPELQPILRETLGILIYQEQTIMIAHKLAGFDFCDAEEFRRDLVQRVAEKVAIQKHKFIKGAKENAINQETSEKIFEFLHQYAGYEFLKAHAVSMATLSIRMAWLKVNYPEEFMTEMCIC